MSRNFNSVFTWDLQKFKLTGQKTFEIKNEVNLQYLERRKIDV